MAKKCVLCDGIARYYVKDMENECYCEECAETNFDLENLKEIEQKE